MIMIIISQTETRAMCSEAGLRGLRGNFGVICAFSVSKIAFY